jgi:hypothetical protein
MFVILTNCRAMLESMRLQMGEDGGLSFGVIGEYAVICQPDPERPSITTLQEGARTLSP